MNLLGAALYDPSSAGTKATSALLAMTAVDTTNLRVAVTVPAHGMLRFHMMCAVEGATTFPAVLLGVLNGASVIARVSPKQTVGATALATTRLVLEADFTATGLTPGAMNCDAAYGVEIVVAATNIKYGGPNNTTTDDAWGAFVFEVWDPRPIPTVVSGGAGGLMISGTNTGPWSVSGGVSFTNSGGSALTLTASGSNGNGVNVSANGTGAGILLTPGATGNGIKAIGGATSGSAVLMQGTAGNAVGLDIQGQGSAAGLSATGGTTGHGISATGGATSGSGLSTVAATSGDGITATGVGTTKHGIKATGGATTSAGIAATGGATSGDGILVSAPTSGHGINTSGAGTTKHGIIATGGATSSAGISAAGGGTGAGVLITGGATGIGLNVVGGGTSGDGIKVTTTSGHGVNLAPVGTNMHGLLSTGGNGGVSDGVKAAAGTGGVDIRGNITGNLVGTVSTLTTYTGNTPQTGDSFARIGVAGAGLTAIDLPNQTMDITGNITGNVSGSVGSVTGAVGSVTGAVGSVTGAVGSVAGNVAGNVVGSVGSVVGAVGSVAGNVVGSVGSVVGLTASNLDTTVSSRLASASYSAPDNAGIADTLAAVTDPMGESYAALGAEASLAQILYEMRAILAENTVAGLTVTAKKLDGSTVAATYAINSATVPTSITRAS